VAGRSPTVLPLLFEWPSHEPFVLSFRCRATLYLSLGSFSHVRDCGLYRPKKDCPVVIEGCVSSNIAATIPPASPSQRQRQTRHSPRFRQAPAISKKSFRSLPRRHYGHRPHPLPPRPSDRRKRSSSSRLHGEIVVVHNGIIENYLELRTAPA